MSLTLPESIASRQDVRKLRTEIERYQAWSAQYQNAAKRDILYQAEQPHLSDAASSLIRAWLADKDSLDDLRKELDSLAASSPSVTVVLAAAPQPQTQQAIVKWLRTELSPVVLVTFRWNSRLLGGMVLQTDTKVLDWSFRSMLADKKPLLVERLLHV